MPDGDEFFEGEDAVDGEGGSDCKYRKKAVPLGKGNGLFYGEYH